MTRYKSFEEFYPFYLSEHARPTTRRMHFLGTGLALGCVVGWLVTGNWRWLAAGLIAGYGFAWASHLWIEKNRPATFSHPFYSLMGDWLMFWQILSGKMKL